MSAVVVPSVVRWASLSCELAAELVETLTNREFDVAWCLALGMSPEIICRQLCISPKTFEVHRRTIYKKKFGMPSPEAIPIVMFLSVGGLRWPAKYNFAPLAPLPVEPIQRIETMAEQVMQEKSL